MGRGEMRGEGKFDERPNVRVFVATFRNAVV